jgi:uncharacterized repeat protein (TIGR01451 family)/MYXO-CTERM domain-containing protein
MFMLFNRRVVTAVFACSLVGGVASCGSNDDSESTSASEAPLFTNVDFEQDLLGWTVTTGNRGLLTLPVVTEANLNITGTGVDRTNIKTGVGPYSLTPPDLVAADSLKMPRFGNKAVVVNELGPNGTNTNTLAQTAIVTAADVDAFDGKVHTRIVYAPVIESPNPAHNDDQQPFYFVRIRNATKDTTLATKFAFADQAGVPWQTSSVIANPAKIPRFTDWTLLDIASDLTQVAIGDRIEVHIIAGRCQPSGHSGMIIVDTIDSFVPGINVVATVAATVDQGQNLQYSYRINNGSSATATNPIVTMVLPANTTFVSIDTPGVTCTTPPVGAAGTVVCNLANVPSKGNFVLLMTVKVSATAPVNSTINHGDYSISDVEERLIIGPLVQTTVNPFIDTDGDGLSDNQEIALGTNPNDIDTDDDGVSDFNEPNRGVDSDGDGLINALDADSDNDGLFDGTELGVATPIGTAANGTDISKGHFIADADINTKTDPLNPDTDGGGKKDGNEDANHNGRQDGTETDPTLTHGADDNTNPNIDTDGDGLSDAEELLLGSNPNDIDTDDDGVADGAEPNPAEDTDRDGLVNVLDPDSDNDGLFDGTESGVAAPIGTAANGTDISKGHFIADADTTTKTNPLLADTDGGGVKDGNEDTNHNGKQDAGETDPRLGRGADDNVAANRDTDGDGISDAAERLLGTDPNDIDTDDDGVSDGTEPNYADDTDSDGLINALDPDSDNDGLFDGTELGVVNPLGTPTNGTDRSKGHFIADADPGTRTNPLLADTDRGSVKDGNEDANHNGRKDGTETDPTLTHGADDVSNQNLDTDGDGISDRAELALGSNPNDIDTDDDGVADGAEANYADDTDGDGLINILDPDADNDGLFDGTESGVTAPIGTPSNGTDPDKGHFIADQDPATRTNPLLADTDRGGVKDGNEDANHDGKLDAGETDPTLGHGADDTNVVNLDTDGDGISDNAELAIGTNPNDIDSDDDGVSDGNEANYADDTDGDGLINALDPDADNDGLFDGTERGVTAPLGTATDGTDVSKGHFIADANAATRTNPLDPDTDHGGVKDGAEDVNHNGAKDGTETDPTLTHGADDTAAVNLDSDGDGLSDAEERVIGSNPNDIDSDDDGVADGKEANYADDTDGDGLINVLDPDADNDGLYDGTELGVTAPLGTLENGTDTRNHHFIADADPTTKTNPLLRDTDKGTVRDGAEDFDHNGKQDGTETDPTRGHGSDDVAAPDSDNDGLPDAEEIAIGSNPMDADTDDDGVLDGAEPNFSDDSDGDGLINVLDPDSDNDGLYDGTELGVVSPNADTDLTKNHFIPDADPATKTNPLNRDTDRGGVSDGAEDVNRDGKVDTGELNPLNRADDANVADRDNDGLSDAQEVLLGSNPDDADSDDDGVLDGKEANPADDTDGDGKINVLDPDSDNDCIFDGTETSVTVANAATDVSKKNFVVDADPTTRTGVLTADTDRGGVKDGLEDRNQNGAKEANETDPNLKSDDDVASDLDGDKIPDIVEGCIDTDGDGMCNFQDADSDADGIPDSVEAGDADPITPPVDTDNDGTPDYIDIDSDNDGIPDGMDNCRLVGNADQADNDRNGVGNVCEKDADGDGIADALDNCPTMANQDQANGDGDAKGDACDKDQNNDGLDDSLGVSGGACSTGGNAGGSATLVLGLFAVGMLLGRRKRAFPKSVAAAVAGSTVAAVLICAGAGSAAAQDAVLENRNFSIERFYLSSDRNGLLGVEWAGLRSPKRWEISLWLGFERSPLVVYETAADGSRNEVGDLVHGRAGGELAATYTLFKRLQLSASLPVILYQDRNSTLPGAVADLESIRGVAVGDLRITPKLGLLRQADGHAFDVALQLAVTVPTGASKNYHGEASLSASPELLISRHDGGWRYALNLGYLVRKNSSVVNQSVKDELAARAGLGYRMSSGLELDVTVSGAVAAYKPFKTFNQNYLEVIAGPSYRVGSAIIFAAGGVGLASGFGNSDWRVLAGLRLGRLDDDGAAVDRDGDRDHDGIVDSKDKCVNEAEDNDKFEDDDGCPDPDNDKDGILDGNDKCIDVAETVNGFQDDDGCPDQADSDGDGITDDNDKCPKEAEDKDSFQDQDGCPDPDNDNDKVLDVNDKCRDVPGLVENQGCPDADRDGDGIVDRLDNCPDQKGIAKNQGCKDKQLVSLHDGKLDILDVVYFKLNKADILIKSNKLLDNVAQVLIAHTEITNVEIQGHTDSQGNDAYNLDLSDRRAKEVRRYLIAKGVQEDRLEAKGYGETQPIADNGTAKGRSANRRVVFKLIGADSTIDQKNSGPSDDTLEKGKK